MRTFADKIIQFNQTLDFVGELPDGINIMNPFKDEETMKISSEFYMKYYNDSHPRHLILGINPGRFGAGVTGIPFTDTKRLKNECGIPYAGAETHEVSSVFIYEMIDAYGGVDKFYSDFYINSVCPLGFTVGDENGRVKNYNYYDSKKLTDAVTNFNIRSIRRYLGLGIETDVCFCFGTGKNEKYLRMINDKFGFFGRIVALEHPRYIMQYKSKSKKFYIGKYLEAFDITRT
jgi:hypothetical protein